MDAEKINSRSDCQKKPNSEVKVDEDTIDDHGLDQSVKGHKLSSWNESSNSRTYSDQNLPMTLWADATSTLDYVHNKSPHQVFGNKTLEEAFTGVKPDVSHLRIFGCLVYIHVPKEKRSNLEPSGKKGTFVGYSETSKAYHIYIPIQRQIEVNQDVTFDEEVSFKRSREYHMEIDGEDLEALRDADCSTLDIHPSYDQREEPTEPIDGPRDVAVVKRRPT